MSDNTILTSTNDTSLPSWICSLIADKLRTLHDNTIQFYTNPNFLAFELFKTENRNCSFCNNIDEARKWISDYATDLSDCGMHNTPSNIQFADPIHKPEEYQIQVIIALTIRILNNSEVTNILNDYDESEEYSVRPNWSIIEENPIYNHVDQFGQTEMTSPITDFTRNFFLQDPNGSKFTPNTIYMQALQLAQNSYIFIPYNVINWLSSHNALTDPKVC